MAGEWTTFRLGAVCTKIGSGATPRGGSGVYLDKGRYSLIRSQNVYNDGFRADGLAFIGIKHATELSNVELLRNDVLLNITGDSVARCCQVDESVLPGRVNQHVAIIRPNPDKLDPRFLRYSLVSPEMQALLLSWAAAGATRNALTKAMIEAIQVSAPRDINEQRAIGEVLGALDDKIELNRRMSETLEAVARALFKSWFVDFDPVRAKAEGRDPGLPKPIADLFPTRLVDSELGSVPEGWSVRSLGEYVQIIKGRSYSSAELTESDTALVTLKSFARGGGYRPDGLKSFSGAFKPEQAVSPGELVIACTDVTQAAEVVGRAAIVRASKAFRTLVASLDTVIVRPTEKVTCSFVYFLAGTDEFVSHTYAHTTGTTVLHLAKEALPAFLFVLPSQELLTTFDDFARPVLDRIQASEGESDTLITLRAVLLPKLISGELRVRDAERLVAEAAG
jgi:type I restriction enzyme S subunit